MWRGLVFDIISFLGGIAAGLLAGVSAGYLHGLESTADLQERVRKLSREVEGMRSTLTSEGGSGRGKSDEKILRLQQDLREIHEEIKRMYKKTSS